MQSSPNKILADLVASNHAPSMSRRLKEHLPAIEECIEAGFSHKAIHDWLVTAGLAMSFEYYQAALARLRKANRRPGRGVPVGSNATSSKHPAPRDQPAGQQAVADMKGAPNSAGIGQEAASAPRSIEVEQPDRKPFTYDPTAADKLDLKTF